MAQLGGTGDPEGGVGETDTEGDGVTGRETGLERPRNRKAHILRPPRSRRPCAHSPVDLVLLPLQAIAVQARGRRLGRLMGAVGPRGSRCWRRCLREASQGCSAIHDAWVVGQLIVLGEARVGKSQGVISSGQKPPGSLSLPQELALCPLSVPTTPPAPPPPPCPMELCRTEGFVPQPSLVPMDCDICPIRDS